MADNATPRNQIARNYVASFNRYGSRHFIGNLETCVDLIDWGDHLLPITINDGAPARTFVCSPKVGYFDYVKEELHHFPSRLLTPPLRLLVSAVEFLLSGSDMDRVVHVNNWMMSTNLPVAIDASLVRQRTDYLISRFPTHLLAMRSLTHAYHEDLMAKLEQAGWVFLPSRQIYLVDDIAHQLASRRDGIRDEALWGKTSYQYEELGQLSAADAQRIAELYAMLYLEKYSQLNPAFSPDFITLTHQIGLIRYLVFRDSSGVIQSFGGMMHMGQYGTMPMVGYNTALDQKLGLFRLAFHAGSRYAARYDLRFNMSSGATAFKRARGGKPEMEYTAFYNRHLPASHRIPFKLLGFVANRIGVPLLERYQL